MRIDLAKLRAAADGPEGEPASIDRRLLALVADELEYSRAALAKQGRVFAGEGKAL